MEKKLGVMVVGLGGMSSGYVKYFATQSPHAQLVAVVDPVEAARERVRQAYNPPLVLSDYRQGLERSDINLVVICTPHDLHHPIAVESLRAGKDVITEKPISITLAEADDMIDTAAAEGRRLFVSHAQRFDVKNLQIKKLLDDGAVGKVFMVHAEGLGYEVKRLSDPNNWKGDLRRAGGGVVLDMGIHVLDALNWLVGKPRSVQAAGGQFALGVPTKGEDTATVLVEYESGAIATVELSFAVCNTGCHKEATIFQTTNFYGSKGTILSSYEWDTITPQHRLDLIQPEAGRQAIALSAAEAVDPHVHFEQCIVEGSEPVVSAVDARNGLAVVQAAYESMRTGQRVDVNWRTA
jgi:predicted dehydrogenase